MRIGIDVRPLQTEHKYRGIGRVAYEELKVLKKIDLENQYFLYVDRKLEGGGWIKNEFGEGNFRVKNLPFTLPERIERLSSRTLNSQISVPLEARKEYLDIFYSFEYFVPFFAGTKFIINIYGLNPFSIDKVRRAEMEKQFELTKVHFRIKHSLREFRDFFLGRFKFNQIAKASLIITGSENSKKDIVNYFNLPADKIFFIPLGVDLSLFKPQNRKEVELIKSKYRINRPYFLFVSTVEWFKNVQGMIKAYILCRKNFKYRHQLVICGMPGRGFKSFQKMVIEDGLQKEIIFTGYTPEEDIVNLYSGAKAYILPSFYEGFGLGCLEAMACGCPVLSSNSSSIPEVVGNAGIYFDPEKPEEIAQAMIKIEKDAGLREQLKQKGFARAREFTWDKSTKKLVGLFQKVNEGKV